MCHYKPDQKDCDTCDSLCHAWVNVHAASHTGLDVCSKTNTVTHCAGCNALCTFPETFADMILGKEV